MSVTINTNPAAGSSLHDTMWHVVSSDNSGVTDFKYVFDVWVNGVQKIRVKQFPDPSNGKGYFDAGPVVRNEMLYEWFEPINTSALVAQPDVSGQIGITYSIRVGEEVSGVTTTNMASGEVSCYNWAPPMFKRRVTSLSDKLNKWFTNRPLVAYSARDFSSTTAGENLFIGFYTDQPSLVMNVQTFDESGNVIETSGAFNITVESGFLQLNIGPGALLGTDFGGLSMEEDVRYYEVWFTGYERIRVYLSCNPKYECIPIHFLNRWGVWDTQRFDLVSKLSMDIKRKGFEQRDYRFNGNAVDYMSSANRYYEGKANYLNESTWNYKLTADAMTDAEWKWIAELFASPQILLEVDGYFYPVTVKATSYDYVKFINDKLKPLEVEFELNTSRYTQLR